MYKLLILLCSLFFMACNNQSAPDSEKNKNRNTSSPTDITSLSRESEMEILAGCVENAKEGNLDEATAYTLCRCVLRQMQEKYPGADSAALVNHLTDTAEVTQLAQKCK